MKGEMSMERIAGKEADNKQEAAHKKLIELGYDEERMALLAHHDEQSQASGDDFLRGKEFGKTAEGKTDYVRALSLALRGYERPNPKYQPDAKHPPKWGD
ncbi:MAG: hypothetical protein NTW66_04170 [Candidatus Magasanikbacteria bacterium]|nr:hypothetical protein [Candidatus Magasanikbacteria bacterium]